MYFCWFMCWWNILLYTCEYSAAIKLKYRFSPKSYRPLRLVVCKGYILTNFWMAEEVNKKVKQKLQWYVLIKNMTYYENTKITLKKGKKKSAQLSCVLSSSRKCKICIVQLKCTANGYRCRMWIYCQIKGHIFEISP